MQPPRKRVVVTAYDPAWAGRFGELSQALSSAIGELAVSIHHVGSTSIPGLAAKPIIDIDVEIASRDVLPAVVERLALVGYEHQGDLGIDGREAFRNRGAVDVPRDGSGRTWPAHHLYVCASNNRQLLRQLAFRDYLRTHPVSVADYGHLKIELARKFEFDIDCYIAGKTDFVEDILRRAGCAV
jgi:GrpB-like predicted nucleotidyltransferase (UPF0157 family)